MSNFSMTPISILDKSPMGGFRGGMSDTRSLMHSDSALESERLSQTLNRQQIETNELNKPMDAAKRAAEIARQEFEENDIKSGNRAEALRIERETKAQELLEKMEKAERERVIRAAEDAYAVSTLFQPTDDEEAIKNKWPTAVEEATRRGIKNFPQEYSFESFRALQQKGAMAPSVIQHGRKLEEVDRNNAAAMARTQVQEAGDDRRNAASNQTQRDIANARLAAEKARWDKTDAPAATLARQQGEAFSRVDEWLKDPTKAPMPRAGDFGVYASKAFPGINDDLRAAVKEDKTLNGLGQELADLYKSRVDPLTIKNDKQRAAIDAQIKKVERAIAERTIVVTDAEAAKRPGYKEFAARVEKSAPGLPVSPAAAALVADGGKGSAEPSAPTQATVAPPSPSGQPTVPPRWAASGLGDAAPQGPAEKPKPQKTPEQVAAAHKDAQVALSRGVSKEVINQRLRANGFPEI
jgi:hypothetical protein